MAKTKMHLAFDYSYTHMGGRWRLPGGWPGRTFPDVDMFEDMARIAERGCLDMIFSGDGTGVPDTWQGSRDGAVEWGDELAAAGSEPARGRHVARHATAGLRPDLFVHVHASVLCPRG